MVLTRQNLGRCQQGRLRPGLYRQQHRFQRHHGLARTDIALQQPQHRAGLRHVLLDLAHRTRLRTGQAERQGKLAPQGAVPNQGHATARTIGIAYQHQGQTVGQQLVIGKPVAGGGMLAAMGQFQSVAPARPLHLVGQPRLDPFGQFGRSGKRLLDQRGKAPLGQPFGQRIDRLHQLPQRGRACIRYVIGVNDLQHLAILIEPPRDPAGLPQRQLLFRPAAVAPEIGDRTNIARAIGSQHAERPAPGWTAVLQRGQRNDDVLAHAGLVQIGHHAARHETIRQMVNEVPHAGQPQPFQRPRQSGADAFQAIGCCKQGIKPFRTHRALMPQAAAT